MSSKNRRKSLSFRNCTAERETGTRENTVHFHKTSGGFRYPARSWLFETERSIFDKGPRVESWRAVAQNPWREQQKVLVTILNEANPSQKALKRHFVLNV